MGVSGNLDVMRDHGAMLRDLVGDALIAPPPFGEGGPLSAGVGGVHDSVARAAVDFAREMDTGLDAAGGDVIQVSEKFSDRDGQHATKIPRVT